MKKYSLLFISIILFSTNLFSQPNWVFEGRYKVGKQPVSVFRFNNQYQYFVLCAGWDANYNGVLDPGDEPPSLWMGGVKVLTTYQKDGYPDSLKKVGDLDFQTIMLPVRFGIDKEEHSFYFAGTTSVIKYLVTGDTWYNIKLTKQDSIPIAASAVSLSSTQKLYLSVRPNYTDPGSVIVYDLSTKKFTDTIPAFVNVQKTEQYDAENLIILNEGTFGKGDSKIQFYKVGGSLEMGQKHKLIKEIELGDGANHFFYDKKNQTSNVYVTMNGSQEVKVINLSYWATSSIPFKSGIYDGPRESVSDIYSTGLFTSSYDGNVYLSPNYDSTSSIKLKAFGKAEGMDIILGQLLVIATPFKDGTYEPDSNITLYSHWLSVDEKAENNFSIQPNPANDYIKVVLSTEMTKNIKSGEIVNSMGQKIMELDNDILNNKGGFSIGLASIPDGVYYLRLNCDNKIITSGFIKTAK